MTFQQIVSRYQTDSLYSKDTSRADYDNYQYKFQSSLDDSSSSFMNHSIDSLQQQLQFNERDYSLKDYYRECIEPDNEYSEPFRSNFQKITVHVNDNIITINEQNRTSIVIHIIITETSQFVNINGDFILNVPHFFAIEAISPNDVDLEIMSHGKIFTLKNCSLNQYFRAISEVDTYIKHFEPKRLAMIQEDKIDELCTTTTTTTNSWTISSTPMTPVPIKTKNKGKGGLWSLFSFKKKHIHRQSLPF